MKRKKRAAVEVVLLLLFAAAFLGCRGIGSAESKPLRERRPTGVTLYLMKSFAEVNLLDEEVPEVLDFGRETAEELAGVFDDGIPNDPLSSGHDAIVVFHFEEEPDAEYEVSLTAGAVFDSAEGEDVRCRMVSVQRLGELLLADFNKTERFENLMRR